MIVPAAVATKPRAAQTARAPSFRARRINKEKESFDRYRLLHNFHTLLVRSFHKATRKSSTGNDCLTSCINACSTVDSFPSAPAINVYTITKGIALPDIQAEQLPERQEK